MAFLPAVIGLLFGAALAYAARSSRFGLRWEHAALIIGLGLFFQGQYMGLFDSPAERMMGDVARILYVHVPAAWIAMLIFLVAGVSALLFLTTSKDIFDSLTEASAEVGVVLGGLLLALGSIFAKPTWGAWWTWDPRLTATAVMELSFIGVLLLRSVVTEPSRRASWTALAAILASVNMPITYMSVRWWRSMHQLQSSPTTMGGDMVFVLRMNALAFLALAIYFVARRTRIAKVRAEELAPAALPEELNA